MAWRLPNVRSEQGGKSRWFCRAHDLSDRMTEGVLYGMVIFSPWAFGTTEEWSMWVMNVGGYTLGGLLLLKGIARAADGSCPRWRAQVDGRARLATRCLAGLTILILLYCVVSAVNARCVYLGDSQYEYRKCWTWLPHSYDARLTWQAFWNYLALALDFWAIRDWLRCGEKREEKCASATGGTQMPRRLKRLLWVLSINGAVLAAQGLLQRALGGGELLWLVEPRINKQAAAQFGPYAYRSNAAQYFLLLWPVVLGFWRWLHYRPVGTKHANNLLPCIVLMAIVPLMSLSRAGAIIGVVTTFTALVLLAWGAPRGERQPALAVAALLAGAVLLGGFLEWEQLQDRFRQWDQSRLEIWRNTWRMFVDNPLFGSGPGAFSTVYDFYWTNRGQGTAQVHNDWLELLSGLGLAGSALVLGALVLTLAHPVRGGWLDLGRLFPKFVYLGLGSCLLYASVDFPLTIYSILFLFILECALLTSLASNGGRRSEIGDRVARQG